MGTDVCNDLFTGILLLIHLYQSFIQTPSFFFKNIIFTICTYMLKTSHYFLTYGIKVTFLNPVFKACETVYTCVLLLFLILLINYLLVSYSLDIHCSVQDSTMYS